MIRWRPADRIAAWATRLHRRLAGVPATSFVYHRSYRLDLQLPEYDTERALRILAYLQQRHLLRRGMLHRPRPASLRRLELVHDHDYLEALQHPGALDTIVGHALDADQQDSFLTSQRAMVGGTLRATKLALSGGGTAVNLGGGLHHALAAQGSGFCAFNDVAVAIATFRTHGLDVPILTVDLDLHDGDGLRTIFAADPTVHTFSIHNQHLGPLEAVESTAVAVGGDVTDTDYLEVLQRELPPVMQRVRPGLVFYLAGSDLHVEDRMGNARLSLEGLVARDRLVMEELGRLDPTPPCVMLLAGGYGPHAWRHSAAFFSWLLTGRADYEPPLDLILPLDQYRRLRRVFANPRPRGRWPGGHPGNAPPGGTGDGSDREARRKKPGDDSFLDDDWALTEEDLGWNLGLRSRLFLDRFSRHGVELALEEAGILERLRERGYRRLSVEIDLLDPLGDILRVVSREDEPLALLELKLRVDTSLQRERRFLYVEWLLLQDAQHRFELDRPLLPGQSYPGLGLLRDVSAGLIVLCERLELDGLVFVPAQYYIADRALIVGRFLDPAVEARLRAVQRALRHLRLEEASAVVEPAACATRPRAPGTPTNRPPC